MDDAKQLLAGVNADNEQLKKSVLALESANTAGEVAELKEKQAKIETAMNEKDETIEKLVKSIEAQKSVTKELNEMDSDVQKRKEVSEFCKNLRSLAKGDIQKIETSESASEFTDFPSLVSTSTISTDKWERIVMNQANGAKWEKNMSDFTSQTKDNTFDKLNILVENLHGIAIFSDDLINDSAYDIVGEVLTSLAEDFAIQIALSGWSGDGVGEMSGILNSADGSGFQEIERVPTAASTSVKLEDIYDLIGALKAPYQTGAQFKANRLGITELRKLRSDSGAGAGTGDFLWQPSNIVGVPATLAGYPISQAQELAADITAASAEGVVFGNFSRAYTMVDRMGVTVLRDNLTQYPNVAYKAKKRVGGGVTKGEALKILQTTA
jgi:HK97 family phage major capsid protein